ncbi:fimbrial protein [Stenotrophomonas sp. C4297]|uniref:fimbrial protein n=1 Tax=Stenotrophomonas sp. C4297 TaxID=3077847 RepID=UPI00293C4284|nr:fimbrial protein [Stenotrophomonas sp. C4297]MDV3510473.1 fimbrial protein [Stenotrophomonas sp. C4297]
MRASFHIFTDRLLLPLLLLCAGSVQAACQRNGTRDGTLDLALTMPNIDRPDARFAGGGSRADDAFNCTLGTEELMVQMPASGLTYVRDIVYEARTYPAYQTSPRSPLLIFNHTIGDLAGDNYERTPLRAGEVTRSQFVPKTAGLLASVVNVYAFFRGGAMESIPATSLGTLEVWSQSDPGNRVRHTVSVQLTVPVLTCTLSAADHTLDDVSANALASAGDTARESAFGVSMNCPSANVHVDLSVADANAAGGTNGVLALATGSTAEGVQIQLLQAGAPVQFGSTWSHGFSLKGVQAIPFTARYLRMPSALVPGTVKGEAVLTATYR